MFIVKELEQRMVGGVGEKSVNGHHYPLRQALSCFPRVLGFCHSKDVLCPGDK